MSLSSKKSFAHSSLGAKKIVIAELVKLVWTKRVSHQLRPQDIPLLFGLELLPFSRFLTLPPLTILVVVVNSGTNGS